MADRVLGSYRNRAHGRQSVGGVSHVAQREAACFSLDRQWLMGGVKHQQQPIHSLLQCIRMSSLYPPVSVSAHLIMGHFKSKKLI